MSTERQYLRHRRDTAANWTAANTVLRAGELGIESDAASLRGKYGDGTTAWADLPYTELGQRPDFEAVTFDTAADVGVGTAQLAWNADELTLDLGKPGGVVLQVGSEQLMLCRNDTASEIPDGTAVRFAGTLGNSGRLLVAPMVADGTYPGYVFFGITTQSIDPGEDGFVTTFGKVRGIDTRDFEEGDILWCDPATPGGLTRTEPQAPNLKLPVAACISKATNGILMVRTDTGRRLMDLHDVEANGSKSNGDVLTWVAANSRWEPIAPEAATPLSLATVASTGAIGDLVDVDLSTPPTDGQVLVFDDATDTWVPGDSGAAGATYADLIYPATGINPPGTANAATTSGSNFPGSLLFAETDEQAAAVIVYLPDTYAAGTDLAPHIHWGKSAVGSENVHWEIDYQICRRGEVANDPVTIVATGLDDETPDTGVPYTHLETDFPVIPGTTLAPHDVVLVTLRRDPFDDADTFENKAYLIQMAFRYQLA